MQYYLNATTPFRLLFGGKRWGKCSIFASPSVFTREARYFQKPNGFFENPKKPILILILIVILIVILILVLIVRGAELPIFARPRLRIKGQKRARGRLFLKNLKKWNFSLQKV